MMPYASTAASRRASIVSTGVKWALVLLVILNLLQLNLLYFSSQGSTRCILKSALATRARSHSAAAPAAAPMLPGSPIGSYEQLGKPVLAHLQKTRSGRYALFVIYAWNYEMLLTAVRSYAAAGFSRNLIIIDNTANSTLTDDPVLAELAADVIPTRTRLTFSQAQNFIADVAIERGYEYYFWGHADVAVIGKDESASFADDVIACVESSFKSRPNWGIIYFHYDWFSAIRTDLVRQVKYDTFVTVYMSDCDFYPRVRAAGFETLNYPEMCPSTSVEVYDLKGPLDIPWKDFDQAKAILEIHQSAEGSRFDWKINAMSDGEKAGWELWERSSYLYFLAKWGPRQEGQPNCQIEVKEPITGNMTLPQKPFGNLAYLQRFWVQEDPNFTNIPILAGLGDQKRNEKDGPKKAAATLKNLRESPVVKDLASAEALKHLLPGQDVEVIEEQADGIALLEAASAAGLAASGAFIGYEAGASSADKADSVDPLVAELEDAHLEDEPDLEAADSETDQSSGFDFLDGDLKSFNMLDDEQQTQEPDGETPDADSAKQPGLEALETDSAVELDRDPEKDSQMDAEGAEQLDEVSLADEDSADGDLSGLGGDSKVEEDLDPAVDTDDVWGMQDLESGTTEDELEDEVEDETAPRLNDATDSLFGDDVAVSEDADELYPEGTESNVLGTFDQEESPNSTDAAEEDSELDPDPLVAEDSDSKDEQNSLTDEKAQPDEEEDRSAADEADMDTEQDGEPEQDAFLTEDDAPTDPEDQDSNDEGLDDLYTETYFSPGSDEDLEEGSEPEDADLPDADSSKQQGMPDGLKAAELLMAAEEAGKMAKGGSAVEAAESDRGSGMARGRAREDTSGKSGSLREDAADKPQGKQMPVQESSAAAKETEADEAMGADVESGEEEAFLEEDDFMAAQAEDSAAGDKEVSTADKDTAEAGGKRGEAEEAATSAAEDVGEGEEEGLDFWETEEGDEFSDPADLGLDDPEGDESIDNVDALLDSEADQEANLQGDEDLQEDADLFQEEAAE